MSELLKILDELPCLDDAHIPSRESVRIKNLTRGTLSIFDRTLSAKQIGALEGLFQIAEEVCSGTKTLQDLMVLQQQLSATEQYLFLNEQTNLNVNGWGLIYALADPTGRGKKLDFRKR